MASLLSQQSNQFKALLSSLREPDPSTQLVALSELANILSMSTEDSLAGYIQTDAFVTELVTIMRGPNAFGEDNPEMMLLACRCLANLMEALPSSTANVAYSQAIPVLCQKLLEIEFIDLAEQALSTLEKISKDYPSYVVREGGMAACLTYLDFFSTNVQRIAVNTTANCAKNVPVECFALVRDVMPALENVVLGSDSKVVDAGCLTLTRVLDSFRHQKVQLEELLTNELLQTILSILSPVQANGTTVSDFIKTKFLHVLSLGAKASPKLAVSMIKKDLVGTLYQLLTGLSKPSTAEAIKVNSVVVLQALIHRSREQVTEILNLITEVLPGLPDDDFFAGLSSKERGMIDGRNQVLENEYPSEYEEFLTIVLPTLLDIYSSTINSSLRKTTLLALLKICYNSNPGILCRVVNDVALASFITGVLGSQELDLVASGLRLATILVERVDEIYVRKLATEGCVAEIKRLEEIYGSCASGIVPASLPAGPVELRRDHLANAEDEMIDTDNTTSSSGDELNDDDDELDDDDDEDEDDDDDEDDEDDDDDDDHVEAEEGEVPDGAADGMMEGEDESVFMSIPKNGTSPVPATVNSDRARGPHTEITKIIIGKRALAFNKVYKLLTNGVDEHDEVLHQLEHVAKLLKSSACQEGYDKLVKLLDGRSEISSYHLRSSGTLSALLETLTCGDKHTNRLLFLEVCMTSIAFPTLVAKLQELLTRAERFEVATSSSSEDKRSASVLAKQVKIKLVADDDSDIPKPFRNLMVSIHAIATFKALDDYLRPRVLVVAGVGSGSGRTGRSVTPSSQAGRSGGLCGRAPDGLQGALAQLAATGTALPESIRERLAGLGVDTGAFMTTESENSALATSGTDVGALIAEKAGSDDDEEEEEEHAEAAAVSVEVPKSGGKAIAKTADGERIPTPTAAKQIARSATSSQKSRPQIGSPGPPGPATPGERRQSPVKQGAMSYAAALNTTPKDYHIEFEVNGRTITHETTIFGAVHTSQVLMDASTHGRPGSAVYLVKFRKVQGPAPVATQVSSEDTEPGQLPSSIVRETEAAPIFQLLDVLYALNTNWRDLLSARSHVEVHELPVSSYINTKLTAKLNRQLEEPLIVASQCLPGWARDLPRFYPFLFPFEIRYLFLQSTSFGYSRSMTRWQAAAKKDRDDGRTFLGRLQRQKVRISRPRMLESAVKVMELYGASPSVLEVEYFDEVGTGLGPTLEFYSTVSREMCKRRLNLWKDGESSNGSEYVFATAGLFPQPLPIFDNEQNVESTKKAISLFRTIGTFLARAMIDSRLVDISFNPAFFRLLTDANDLPPSIGTLYGVDKSLAKSLSLLKRFADAFARLQENTTLSPAEMREQAAKIIIDDVCVDDLGLDFTYPGMPEIELVADGSQVEVSIDNVADYVDRVISLTLGKGIERQCAAFKEGFSQVFPYTALRAFTPAELTMLFGRSEEDWSVENLLECIKADHGFTMESLTIRNLVSVLSQFEEKDRRDFLQFITGSPKLPVGGFKSLTPQFTVVCKPHEPPLVADDYLPSVMTCVNYLKMPDYSSERVLSAKLLVAMREGGGSFHLS